jgi:hypothetical protein
MFGDPIEVLRHCVDLVVMRCIRKERDLVEEIVAPQSSVRQMNLAGTDRVAMLTQAIEFGSGRDDHDNPHPCLMPNIAAQCWALPSVLD